MRETARDKDKTDTDKIDTDKTVTDRQREYNIWTRTDR